MTFRHASGPRRPSAASAPVRSLALALATAAGAGLAPIAPGTAGSALAAAAFVLLSPERLALYGGGVLVLAALGIWSAGAAERIFERGDDGRIVIDEVVGQLLTLGPLVGPGAAAAEAFPGRQLGAVVTGFVAFRVFDIWKPGPVGWAERRLGGGLGVMADDVVAGLLGAAVLAAALQGAALAAG